MEETASSSVIGLVSPALNKRSLWMGSIDASMDEKLIVYAFEKMGERVEGVKFIKDKVTGRNSGYCFLEFKDQETAEGALSRVNGKPIPNYPHLTFLLANTRTGTEKAEHNWRRSEYSLFVGNLTDDVQEADLLHFFSSRYSTVKEATLCKTANGTTKGFGFVRFFNENDQQAALRRMDGVRGLGSRTIYVKLATPKSTYSRARYTGGSGERQNEHQDTHSYYNQQSQASQYPQAPTNNPYYYGGDNTWTTTYQPYQANYPQPYEYPSQQQDSQVQPNTQPQTTENPEEKESKAEEEEPADQEMELNIDTMNEEFISNNEELYSSLEKSRWHFVDYVTTTIDEVCMT